MTNDLTPLCPLARYYQRYGHPYQLLTEWILQLLRLIQRWLPGRALVGVIGSNVVALKLLVAVSGDPLSLATWLTLNAALYGLAADLIASRQGRSPKKGKRLATLSEVAVNPITRWQRLTVALWYGEIDRTIEIASATAKWFHHGMPPVAARWVLIRCHENLFKTQTLLCTHLKTEAKVIMHRFVQRWCLEVRSA